jgi:hypothetical protein
VVRKKGKSSSSAEQQMNEVKLSYLTARATQPEWLAQEEAVCRPNREMEWLDQIAAAKYMARSNFCLSDHSYRTHTHTHSHTQPPFCRLLKLIDPGDPALCAPFFFVLSEVDLLSFTGLRTTAFTQKIFASNGPKGRPRSAGAMITFLIPGSFHFVHCYSFRMNWPSYITYK